jgi:hypothetical protein
MACIVWEHKQNVQVGGNGSQWEEVEGKKLEGLIVSLPYV